MTFYIRLRSLSYSQCRGILKKYKKKGQTFLEFILLLATVTLLSTILIKTSGRGIGRIWQTMINTVIGPYSTSKVQLR